MRSERGQASVEWIGLVLLLALGLGALARFAARTDAAHMGPELLGAIVRSADAEPGTAAPASAPRTLVTAPPLTPVAPRAHRPPLTRARPPARPVVWGRALLRRVGRRAGGLYRRAWMFCLGYERVRYDLLHPESSAPHVGIPLSESVRMANDCVSPVDLVRDYDLIRGRP